MKNYRLNKTDITKDPAYIALHAECDRWEAEAREIMDKHKGGDLDTCMLELQLSLMFSQAKDAAIIFGPVRTGIHPTRTGGNFTLAPWKIAAWATGIGWCVAAFLLN